MKRDKLILLMASAALLLVSYDTVEATFSSAIFNSIFDPVAEATQGEGLDLVSWIKGVLTDTAKEMAFALEAFGRWCVCFFFSLGSPLLERLLTSLPAESADSIGWFITLMFSLDDWFAFSHLVGLATLYVELAFIIIIYRFVLKLIPGIG